ncbi:Acetyltransferase (GNAT) family protein [Aquimarina amphilecti]|uniref:Acetyltransferase (GNAT) family protein n=1 Tax=Aquimarina amphilecti TaxID=1038014 RepID=A0A1H7TFB3_AQUAM|nr:GNAT family N-acetyltransferase [Aquimarina amphilecti]SEL83084.1 Acetyltransferase (GNAT) family protein [Aquimarina amphilecti]
MKKEKEFTIEGCDKKNIKTIVDGINTYNLNQVPAIADIWTPLEFVIKDKNGNEIGGILAGIGYWNGLEIKILWVKEEYRKKGIGTQLLKHTEKIAREKGSKTSMLDTFDFQAEAFYLKNDYTPIGEINDFPMGHKRIYFSKELTNEI